MSGSRERRGQALFWTAAAFVIAGGVVWGVADYRTSHDADLHELEHLDEALLALLLIAIGGVFFALGVARRSTTVAFVCMAVAALASGLCLGNPAGFVVGVVLLPITLAFAGIWLRSVAGPRARH